MINDDLDKFYGFEGSLYLSQGDSGNAESSRCNLLPLRLLLPHRRLLHPPGKTRSDLVTGRRDSQQGTTRRVGARVVAGDTELPGRAWPRSEVVVEAQVGGMSCRFGDPVGPWVGGDNGMGCGGCTVS